MFSQTLGGSARRHGVSRWLGISDGGFKYTCTYPGPRALGLRQDSKSIRETIKVKAEVLALANGNNHQVARQGLMHMEQERDQVIKLENQWGGGLGIRTKAQWLNLVRCHVPE